MATIKKQLTLTFKQPNIAESYGPYTSISAAHTALSEDQLNVVGMTIGIQTGNTIEEYWYQGGTDEQHLVKKQSSAIQIDDNPTENSPNAVSSGGVYSTIKGLKIKFVGKGNDNLPLVSNPIEDTIYACLRVQSERGGNSTYSYFTYKDNEWQNISQGPKGDGNFTFIKFSEDMPAQDSDIHDLFNPSSDRYIGVYNGLLSEAPTNYLDYNWGKFNGASALDIYNELNPNAQLDKAGFIAKLQQKYPMKHAGYYETSVEQTIGTPFTGALDGDELLPTSNTMGNLYIMPNSGTTPTGSIAFTTINTGENQYAWVSLGAVNIPYNALTEDDVDDECVDGLSTKPASAKAVSDLKYRLYGESGTVNRVLIEEGDNTVGENNLCNSKWIICKEDNNNIVTEPTSKAFRWYSGGRASYVINLSKYGNPKKLYVKCHGDYNAYITFLKKGLSSISNTATSFTLQQLIDNQILCPSEHYDSSTNTWKNAKSIPNNSGALQEIIIPEDAKYIYFAGRCWNVSINSFEGANIYGYDRRLPDYLEIEYEVQDAENSDIGGLNEAVTELRNGLESISSQGDELYNEVYGEFEEIEKNGYGTDVAVVLKGCAPDRGEFINKDTVGKIYAAWKINVEEYTRVVISPSAISTLLCITKSEVPRGSNVTIKGATMWSTYCDQECYELNSLSFSDGSVYRAIISTETTIYLTDNSKFLYIKRCDADGDPKYEPQSITLYKEERVGGLVELKSSDTNIGSSAMITLSQGYYGNDGKFITSNNFVTTSPIPMYRGCHFRLFDDYRIFQAYLFDNNGKLVNTNEMYAHQQQWANAFTNPWRAIILPQFFVRFKIGTLQGEDGVVSVDDKIFKEFAWLDNPRIRRKIPTNASMRAWATNNNVTLPNNYDIEGAFPKVHKRTNTLLNLLWKPVRNPIAGVALGSTGTGINYGREGQLMHGAPYSEPSEYNKYIGNHVSIRTFLTAVLNPRSVVYTENLITGGESSYGLSHHVVGSNAAPLSGPYYGTVCTGYTSYAQGRENIRLSDQFSSTSGLINLLDMYSQYEYGTRTTNPYPTLNDGREPFDIIEPLDILWYTGHGMLVTDVYTDEFGRNKYVVITEQTIPVTRSSVYTRETFRDRFVKKVTDESGDTDKWTIYRFCDWTDDIYESDTTKYYDEDTELTQREFDDYAPLKEASVEDEDIQCFAGDYAAFAIGDPSQAEGHDPLNNNKMYLNIRRGGENGYTHIQIFNEEDDVDSATPIADLSIADGSSYVDSTTVIMSNDRTDDYIIFDLASYWNSLQDKPFGKFKTRVVRKESGIIPTPTEGKKYVTGCVHFEMLYVNFEMTKVTGVEGATYKCEFGTSGIPYLIRKEKINGMPQTATEPKFIKSSDYESDEGVNSGNVYVNWTKTSPHIYAKLYIRGEYGVVVRRLEMPDA